MTEGLPVDPAPGFSGVAVQDRDLYNRYTRMSLDELDVEIERLQQESKTNRSPYQRITQALDQAFMARRGLLEGQEKQQRMKSYMARHKSSLLKLTINGQALDTKEREHLAEFCINDIGATIIDAAIGTTPLSDPERVALAEFVRVIRL